MGDGLHPRRIFLLNTLDILTLGSLAVSQPVFDLLARNVDFLSARHTDSADIVLLTLIVTFTVPVPLALVELIACVIGKKTYVYTHATIVWLLVALLLAPLFKPLYSQVGAWSIVAALLSAGVLSQTYLRLRSRGIALAYISPIALLFPVLFVLHSPVYSIVRPATSAPPVYSRVSATAPIVMVVFDEFPLVSLMDEQGQIDPHRYPNFAALAQQATWYRNASTVTESTLRSVPAILDGRLPDPGSRLLADAKGHPNSLFILLGGSYGMNVVESNTMLCPEDLCAPSNTGLTRAERLYPLFSDLGVLYLYLLLPSELTRPLPNITLSWAHFKFAQAQVRAPGRKEEDFDRMTTWEERSRTFAEFVHSIQPRSRPTLNFLHVLLPHAPWEYLPSAKRYAFPEDRIRGLTGINSHGIDPQQWNGDSWALEQAYQRHLLQVEMVDRLIGNLIEHLKKVNLFEPCLLVITADHGASFLPNVSRRVPSQNNYADILAVPLFVKAPYQEKGEVNNRNIESIDILPTVADILRIPLPWRTDGKSALDPSGQAKSTKVIVLESGERLEVDARLSGLYDSIRRKNALFGNGPDALFRVGPHRELLGLKVTSLVTESSTVECDLQGRQYFEQVDPKADFVLTNVTGILSPRRREVDTPRDLAVAINGEIRAVTQSYVDNDGAERFSAVLSDTDFRPGFNKVAVYLITKAGDRLELAETRSSGLVPYHWGDALRFGLDGNARPYLTTGWSKPEDQITWSDSRKAELILPTSPARGPIRLRIYMAVYLAPGKMDSQRVRLFVNRRLVAEWTLASRDFGIVEASIPGDFFSDPDRTVITFETPDSISPITIGDGNDLRQLGIAVSWLSLSE